MQLDWCKVSTYDLICWCWGELKLNVLAWWSDEDDFMGILSNTEVKAAQTKSCYFPVGFYKLCRLIFFSEVCNVCRELALHNMWMSERYFHQCCAVKVPLAEWSRTQIIIYHFHSVSVSQIFLAFLDQHIWGEVAAAAAFLHWFG